MKKLWFLAVILTCFTLSCSSGGSSSGSGGNITSSTVTYAQEDLAGNWLYTERQQGGSKSCSGTMTFDRNLHLTGMSNSCCPQGQILSPVFWFWSYGYVKGRNYAWCSNPTMETKYSLNFQGSDKNSLSGLMDVHETQNEGDNYTRFDITMTREIPVPPPPPPSPEPTVTPQVKKAVKTVGLSGAPAKK